jgi:hypothetical protein
MSSQVVTYGAAVPMAVSLATRSYSGCGSEQINLYWIRSIELFVHTMKGNQKLAINVTLSLQRIYSALTYVGTPVSPAILFHFFLGVPHVIRQETKMLFLKYLQNVH